jgi:hypothetical protein
LRFRGPDLDAEVHPIVESHSVSPFCSLM